MSLYRISQLTERTGVPALRFYGQQGLLPAQRSAAGYRLYGDAAVDRSGSSRDLPSAFANRPNWSHRALPSGQDITGCRRAAHHWARVVSLSGKSGISTSRAGKRDEAAPAPPLGNRGAIRPTREIPSCARR
jgi:hypothetical protein